MLVGRDLIEAAHIRRQISQIEQYKLATATFRTKYGGIPGDLKSDAAIGFGMISRSGNDGHGDGDGRIESCAAYYADYRFGCEAALFWTDLSFSEFIPTKFSSATDTLIDVTYSQIDNYLPKALLGTYTRFAAFTRSPGISSYGGVPTLLTCSDRVCLSLAVIFEAHAAWHRYILGGPGENWGIAPAQAFAIDSKMDDGQPFTGTVNTGYTMNAESLAIISDAGYYDDGLCLSVANAGTSPNDLRYVLDDDAAHQPQCAMNFVVH